MEIKGNRKCETYLQSYGNHPKIWPMEGDGLKSQFTNHNPAMARAKNANPASDITNAPHAPPIAIPRIG